MQVIKKNKYHSQDDSADSKTTPFEVGADPVPLKPEKLSASSLVDVFSEQQHITLNKLKKEDKNATNDADGNATAERADMGGDHKSAGSPDI